MRNWNIPAAYRIIDHITDIQLYDRKRKKAPKKA